MQKTLFEVTENDGIQIIRIDGTLEQNMVDKVFRQIEENIIQKNIILDLANVGFVNSTFIGYLYHLFETNKNSGKFFCFVNGQENVMDAFNLTGVLDLIPYYKSLDEALIKINKV